eukprot:TRINITY_DN12120_c0_g1_i1.p1 TRINITY_DN12120_c0_g1~~TRINITY_DN12120_c0_g1_i1.p1  ORF type:complete len:447 (+),score=52.67 TRINITY_DN12120_c0_g1_i1:110-1342(+)
MDPDNRHIKGRADTKNSVYPLTPDDLAIFANASYLQEYMQSVVKMEVKFPPIYNVHLERNFAILHSWTGTMKYDFSQRGGRIAVSLELIKGDATSYSVMELMSLPRIIIDLVLMVLCAVSSAINVRAVASSFGLLQAARKRMRNGKKSITWKEIPLRLKLRFFNAWFIMNLIGNLLLIIGCVFDIFWVLGPDNAFQGIENVLKFCLGTGCLLSYINLIRYLEFDEHYMILIRALGKGMPQVFRFIVGVAPFFIGYALFGMLYFSDITQRFENLDTSVITLFGLQNGDEVQATLRSTTEYTLVSRLYLYTFLFIAIYAVVNIFIAIMENSYSQVRLRLGDERNQRSPKEKTIQHVDPDSDLNGDEQLCTFVMTEMADSQSPEPIHILDQPHSNSAPSLLGKSRSKFLTIIR